MISKGVDDEGGVTILECTKLTENSIEEAVLGSRSKTVEVY